jgi:uncharacterized RmlC-like cupin family protein
MLDAIYPILDRMNTWFGEFHITLATSPGDMIQVQICKE